MVPQSSLPGVLFIVPFRELEGRLFAQNTFTRSIVSAENMLDVGGRKQYARTFGLLIRVMAQTKRSSALTDKDILYLTELVNEQKVVILSRDSKSAACKRKKEAWEEVIYILVALWRE